MGLSILAPGRSKPRIAQKDTLFCQADAETAAGEAFLPGSSSGPFMSWDSVGCVTGRMSAAWAMKALLVHGDVTITLAEE